MQNIARASGPNRKPPHHGGPASRWSHQQTGHMTWPSSGPASWLSGIAAATRVYALLK